MMTIKAYLFLLFIIMKRSDRAFENSLFKWKNISVTFKYIPHHQTFYRMQLRINVYVNWWLKECYLDIPEPKYSLWTLNDASSIFGQMWYEIPNQYNEWILWEWWKEMSEKFRWSVYHVSWFEREEEFSKYNDIDTALEMLKE